MKGSLRGKIITWSFVPTAIILVAVGLVSLYTYQQVTDDLVVERDRELTRLSATLLARELEAYTDPLAEQYLAVFDGIVVFDANGNVVAAEPMQYEQRLPSWFQSVAVRQALSSAKPVFSNIVVDTVGGTAARGRRDPVCRATRQPRRRDRGAVSPGHGH